MKRIALNISLALSTMWLSACAITQWISGNEEAIKGAADTASGFGATGGIISLALTTALGAAKWYENRITVKELIASTQAAKQRLPAASKKILSDGYDEYMSDRVKKVVSKVKAKLT